MLSEEVAKTFAAELVSYACGRWAGGRSEEDPIYREITEHRDVGAVQKTYSSCGDLGHWLLYRMGCRSKFINRKEHLGWQIGANVSKLVSSSVAENARETDVYGSGDILVIWSKPAGTDAHVLVVLDHRGATLTSGEYGQPGGRVRTHELVRAGFLGQRKIQKVLRLARVMQDAERQSLLLEPDYTALPKAQAYAAAHAGAVSVATNV